jgi:amidase
MKIVKPVKTMKKTMDALLHELHWLHGLHVICLCLVLGLSLHPAAQVGPRFDVVGKSISELQQALAKKEVTSHQLVVEYLARIAAYDQAGPRINAFITLNPRAILAADELDAERARGRVRGPLHGIPLVIKDNYDTVDMPTSAASIALATFEPAKDAFQVGRLREAGAIILGKTNLHELAAGIVTVSSLGGQTRNPYDPTRNPGGSSGGTGAAIAASFAPAGLGTDTCGSIRIPSAHNGLVGLRPSAGLSSRAGVVPLSHTQDVAGPLARTVQDIALLLDATVAIDPDDPTTAASRGHVPRSYVDSLRGASLKGARIGLLQPLFGDMPADAEAGDLVKAALDRMKGAGAEVVVVEAPDLTELMRNTSVIDAEFKFDLADYLAARPSAPVRSLGEILERGLYHENLDATLRRRNAVESRDSEAYRAQLARRIDLAKAIQARMDEQKLTALAYPTVRRKAAPIGEAQAGANCQLSASTGFPSLALPAGFTPDGLPIGFELLGRAFSEVDLLRLGAAYEQLPITRRTPASTPRLPVGGASSGLQPLSQPRVVTRSVVTSAVQLQTSFAWNATKDRLIFRVDVSGASPADVVLVAVHRAEPDKTGPVIAQLLRAGSISASGELPLREVDRPNAVNGRLYVELYTRQHPLGTARSTLVVK